MTKGISLHIGVNKLDAQHYLHTEFQNLKSCVNDALAMREIARQQGFTDPVPEFNQPNLILTDDRATSHNVIKAISSSLLHLKDDDIFLITFAGHGGQVKDIDRLEGDGQDETWCLFDRQLLDDELLELWSLAQPKVRIVVVSDSCHNGTVTGNSPIDLIDLQKFRVAGREFNRTDLVAEAITLEEVKITNVDEVIMREENLKLFLSVNKESNLRTLDRELLTNIYENNKAGYNQIQEDVKRRLVPRLTSIKQDIRDLVQASVLLISACQDWQKTRDGVDGNDHGDFTKALLKVWEAGEFSNYLTFHEAIWKELQTTQTPSYYRSGNPNPAFEMQKPFTV